MFLTSCSHHWGISQANHLFLFVPRCPEKPTEKNNSDDSQFLAFDSAFYYIHTATNWEFHGIRWKQKAYPHFREHTYHSKVKNGVLFFKDSFIPTGVTGNGPGAGCDKRQAFIPL